MSIVKNDISIQLIPKNSDPTSVLIYNRYSSRPDRPPAHGHNMLYFIILHYLFCSYNYLSVCVHVCVYMSIISLCFIYLLLFALCKK